MKNKLTRFILILSIVTVTYNIVLFLIAGFTGHSAAFWISWACMMIGFAILIAAISIIGTKSFSLRDWLFGYPFIRHSIIYIICTFVISTICMVLNHMIPWQLVLALQIIVLAAYLVFSISCMVAKETIQKVDLKVSDKTRFIRLLKIDAEMLVEKCDEPELKQRYMQFAEAVRYSDPMSSDTLFELEKDIALMVAECDSAITNKEYALASELCDRVQLLLSERNKKTKVLK
ncbi:MAG: hypothetical protein IKJ91_04705 [Clostridia bacterium]|nr:hypothetical protein [Clostridia bacterium]